MKGIITVAIGISLLFIACKKDSNSPSSGGNGNKPPTPPAGGSKITVTGISPQNPHPDNVITITGTGFNADMTKDIVYFGNYDTTKKIFRAYSDGQDSAYKSNIFSASATQLVFRTLDSLLLDINELEAPEFNLVPAVEVIANGDTAVYRVTFKEMVRIGNIRAPYEPAQVVSTGWPGDSLTVDCLGPVDQNAILTIDGIALPFTAVNIPANLNHETLLRLWVPKSFGTSNDDTLATTRKLELALGDGTVERQSCKFYSSPVMRVTNIAPASSSYSHGGLATSGGVININVTGSNLKSDAMYNVVITGVVGVVASGTLDVANFPDQATITLPGTLPVNNYTLSISRKNVSGGTKFYGNVAFNVSP